MLALLALGAATAAPLQTASPFGGIVVDRVTGLTWDRCALGAQGPDCQMAADGSDAFDFAAARHAVAAANRMRYKGFDDWRLPSFAELNAIVRVAPREGVAVIDEYTFPGTPAGPFWTPTVAAGAAVSYLAVDFATGASTVVPAHQRGYVRLVRNGVEPPPRTVVPAAHAVREFISGGAPVLNLLARRGPEGGAPVPLLILALPWCRRRSAASSA